MWRMLLATIGMGAAGWDACHSPAAQPATGTATVKVVSGKDSLAGESTRTKLLKVKVSVNFQGVSLREALKEFAALVEMNAERPVMWTYAEEINPGQKVTYACTEKPLDAALGELFTTLKLGYYVVSDEAELRDGWVRVTAGTERGYRHATDVMSGDEQKAATRLAAGKEQIEKGRTATGRAILNGLVEKFPKTKAAAEAKALLEKLDK